VLDSLLQEISQLRDYIQNWQSKGTPPTIEKDIVLSKLQQVYNQIMHLGTSASIASEIHKPFNHEKTVIELEVPEKESQIVHVEPEPHIQKSIPQVEELIIVEHESPIVQEVKVEITVQDEVIEMEQELKIESEKPKAAKGILADKLSQSHRHINESISKSRNLLDLSSKLKSAPIATIQSAINLNDKFVIIRELFKNNTLLYNQTLDRFNNSKDFDEAISIIEREFAWDMDEPLVLKLIDLIKRKHNA
jgi:hypothetical protein